MSILDRLFRRGQTTEPEEVVETPPCPHIALAARWDSTQDMGDESKASGFTCSCGETFSPEEAAQLRAGEAERVRRGLG